jgi:hypothetical protein
VRVTYVSVRVRHVGLGKHFLSDGGEQQTRPARINLRLKFRKNLFQFRDRTWKKFSSRGRRAANSTGAHQTHLKLFLTKHFYSVRVTRVSVRVRHVGLGKHFLSDDGEQQSRPARINLR